MFSKKLNNVELSEEEFLCLYNLIYWERKDLLATFDDCLSQENVSCLNKEITRLDNLQRKLFGF